MKASDCASNEGDSRRRLARQSKPRQIFKLWNTQLPASRAEKGFRLQGTKVKNRSLCSISPYHGIYKFNIQICFEVQTISRSTMNEIYLRLLTSAVAHVIIQWRKQSKHSQYLQ